jgi:hypothetical protein
VSKLASTFGVILLLSILGCGSGTKAQSQASRANIQISTCGAHGGLEFRLHKVDCEIANTLIVMIDGRALRQSVIFMAEGRRRGAWVCTSPTHSLVDRLHCWQGPRYFTVARARQRDD